MPSLIILIGEDVNVIDMLYAPFQKWAEKGSVYIFSDTHFNDADCKLMDKNWIPAEQQLAIINKIAHKNDTLVLLGDVGDLEVAKRIKAYKVLIKGNHDDEAKAKYLEVFDEVYDGPLMIAEKILLSHEPIQGLDFVVNFHGHDHSQWQKNDRYHKNFAANVIGYKPISLKTLIKNGAVSKIQSIHRETINRAVARKNA